jgi:hypothetical protein
MPPGSVSEVVVILEVDAWSIADATLSSTLILSSMANDSGTSITSESPVIVCQCWGPRPLELPFHLPESAQKRRVAILG